MRKFIMSAAVIALASTSAHGLATTKFQENIVLPEAQAVKVNISVSEDLAYRADHLPKKLRQRSGSRGLNDGFGGNGFYGQKSLDQLQATLDKKVRMAFEKQGVEISDSSPYTLNLVITDAKPTRPTMTQMGKQPNLSYQSRALGGATIEGELLDAAGNSLGTVSYGWYESDIRDTFASGTWTDARRAMGRFANKTAKTISN